MEQKSKFDKVMGAWDILVIAFGAMIGWGWVINSGDWITTAGFMGSIIAMLIGGVKQHEGCCRPCPGCDR